MAHDARVLDAANVTQRDGTSHVQKDTLFFLRDSNIAGE